MEWEGEKAVASGLWSGKAAIGEAENERTGRGKGKSIALAIHSLDPSYSVVVVRLIVIHAFDPIFGPKGWCALRTLQESGIGRDLYRMRSVVRRSGQDAPPTRRRLDTGRGKGRSIALAIHSLDPSYSVVVVRLIVIHAFDPSSDRKAGAHCAPYRSRESEEISIACGRLCAGRGKMPLPQGRRLDTGRGKGRSIALAIHSLDPSYSVVVVRLIVIHAFDPSSDRKAGAHCAPYRSRESEFPPTTAHDESDFRIATSKSLGFAALNPTYSQTYGLTASLARWGKSWSWISIGGGGEPFDSRRRCLSWWGSICRLRF